MENYYITMISSLKISKRAINFGDGFFETIRIINGEILFFESHYNKNF